MTHTSKRGFTCNRKPKRQKKRGKT